MIEIVERVIRIPVLEPLMITLQRWNVCVVHRVMLQEHIVQLCPIILLEEIGEL